ncbi:MAG: hypothetical protein MN733_21715 [Nitrososphaera sp.]|nr:hypothetical protein [Nitrososphaera sp.]
MGIEDRPATCMSCGKRLNRKSWYYRNGKHFCTKRCWKVEHEKVLKEKKEQQESSKEGSKEVPAKESSQEASAA